MRGDMKWMYKLGMMALIVMLASCSPQKAAEKEPVSAADWIAKESVKEWDLLWISDSSGWDVADVYGAYVAEDLGIQINVMDKWMGGLAAGSVLKPLRGEPSANYDLEHMADYIKEAEIIVFYGNPEESDSEVNPGDWNCGTEVVNDCYVNSCSLESFDQYIEHLKEIYAIIYQIRAGKPTMLRAFDAYNPRIVADCSPDGVFDECRVCWETYNQAIHQAADEMGVPVANVFDAFNGPDHTEDPNDKGYTKDGVHPNENGAQVIAGLLRDLGYEMVIP